MIIALYEAQRCINRKKNNTMWYVHTINSYSEIKKNKLLIYLKTWMNFKNITTEYVLYNSIYMSFYNRQE